MSNELNFINTSEVYSRMMGNQQTALPSQLWTRMKMKWNGGQQLPDISPTISACTTSTNLSNLEFQSSATINKFINDRKSIYFEENFRITEIEPLQRHPDKMNINSCEITIETSKRKILNQVITAFAVSLVSLVIGYTSGYTSPAESSLKKELGITDFHFAWISGIMPLTAVGGGLLGGPLIEMLGRKWTIFLTNILFLIGWCIIVFAQNGSFLYASRAICGIAVGIASLVLPVYLGETIQPEVRGTLGLLPTAFGNIGILLCFTMGLFFNWKMIAVIGIGVSIPFLLLVWKIPETPRWYISKNKPDECREALKWLRGATNIELIEKEQHELTKSHESQTINDNKSDSVRDLFTKGNVKSMLIVLGLMFFQQMSGINAIIFYTTQIFEDTGSSIPSSIQTIIVGAVNFISTFIATFLIDRLGRKILLYISSCAMIITLTSLGIYFYLREHNSTLIVSYEWLPLLSFVVYVLGFSLGFGPIPWLMMGEILPAKIRGPAASISTAFNWTFTFIVTTAFHSVKDIIGQCGVFWLFAAVVSVGLVFIIIFVPETKGQSLEEIEKKLAGIKVRRMSSIVNIKPLQNGV